MQDALHHCEDGREGSSRLARESNGCSECSSAARDLEGVAADGSQKEQDGETNGHSFTECCRSVFRDVIVSEKFVSFCNLLCEHFKGIKADSVFNFSLINSRMSSGQYEQAPELLASDVQQVISCSLFTLLLEIVIYIYAFPFHFGYRSIYVLEMILVDLMLVIVIFTHLVTFQL